MGIIERLERDTVLLCGIRQIRLTEQGEFVAAFLQFASKRGNCHYVTG